MKKRLLNVCLTAILMAVSMSAYALDKIGNVYQIGSAEDYFAFVQLVNSGARNANAVLTADIDLGTNNTKMGLGNQGYLGVFDGAGHTITVDFSEGTAYNEGPALFHSVDARAIIKRLRVQGTLRASQYKHTAAFANYCSGIIRDCIADVHVIAGFPATADASIGGIAGQLGKIALIENCLAKIKITGATTHKCAGLAAWVDAKYTNIANCLVINDDASDFDWSDGKSAGLARDGDNLLGTLNLETYNADSYMNRPMGASANNYVTNDWGKLGKAATVISNNDLSSGKVCYQLNTDQSQIRWVQRVGTDPYPVPAAFGSGRVYCSVPTNCCGVAEGGAVYSNNGTDNATRHTYDKYGVCTTCGQFNWNSFDFDNPERFDIEDHTVLLSRGEDLFLAEGWNRLQNGFKFDMKMKNDITCISEPGQLIFNNSDWIECSLNGGGHTLTIEMVDLNVANTSLFPLSYAYTKNFVVENVMLRGKIHSNFTGKSIAGAITSREYGSGSNKMIFRNVFSDVEISLGGTGDKTSGGLVGQVDRTTDFENCICASEILVPEGCDGIGGFAGWSVANGSTLTNCAFVGSISNSANLSTALVRNYGSQKYNNVYAIDNYGDQGEASKYTLLEDPDAVGSGELAYLLNGKQSGVERFYQLIGTDPVPSPVKKDGALVYVSAGQYRCDGTPIGDGVSYTNNSSSEIVIPPHQFQDGWCSVCGTMEEDYLTPVDGWLEVSNGGGLAWWSAYAEKHPDINVRLTADIDMEDYSQYFVPAQNYTGTFDGQHHIISNFVYESNNDYQGLIGSICDGAVIKNFTLDETCSIKGNAFVGIVGGTLGSGHIYISKVGNEGTVISVNQNAAGLVGVDNAGAMTMHITDCYVSGEILGGRESGAICGYSSADSEVINCWSTARMPQTAIYRSDSFTRGTAKVTNCYEADIEGVDPSKQQHIQPADEKYRANPLTEEDLASGLLCFSLNEKKFRNPAWYQTLGEDPYPVFDSTHGVVLYEAEQLMNITEDDLPSIVNIIADYYNDKMEDYVAYTGAIEAMQERVNSLSDVETVSGLADALDSLYARKATVEASVEVYRKYQTSCEDKKTYLQEHDDFSGPGREALEDYLENDYVQIIENHELPDSLVEKETAHVEELFATAIKMGYVAGAEVTSLFENTDFHEDVRTGWTSAINKYATSRASVTIKDKPYYACEAWNAKFDMHQTVTGLKPGYYLVGVQGAFRPGNDRYSYNYAAQVYANNNVNYLQAVIEDYVSASNAINGENVYIEQTGGGSTKYDWPVYEDGFSTDGDEGLLGYVVQGTSGMAVAGYAGRYQNYIIAKSEGDSLTIGINNPGSSYGSDWTGFSSFSIVYAGNGDETEPYVDIALESMVARANAILEKYRSEDFVAGMSTEAQAPNYPAELKGALEAAIAAADSANGTEAKMQVVEKLSQLFQEFYEARQAYLAFLNATRKIEIIEGCNLPLVEKNTETGEWEETDKFIFSDAELDDIFSIVSDMGDAYVEGSYNTQEAKDAAALNFPILTDIVPPVDEEGYYLVSTPKQFVTYRALIMEYDPTVKAKLTNDIDMTGIGMQPIGNYTVGTNDQGVNYKGTLDGQGHALKNVYIKFLGGRGCALFYELENATIRNLKLTGEYYADMQRMGGLTRYTSGATTIQNCEIAVTLYNSITADATSGGITGCSRGGGPVNIKDCIVNCTVIAPNANCFGGVCGWRDGTLNLTNVLILSQYQTTAEPASYPGDVIARNGCNINNVYYAEHSLVPGASSRGEMANDRQLASGEVCYSLNKGRQGSETVWFQTLGQDPAPVLDNTHLAVLYDIQNGYYNPVDDPDAIVRPGGNGLTPVRGAMYNVAGQRVSKVQSGIYIVDGKKLLVK